MKSLLLATSIASFIFLKACGGNSVNKEEVNRNPNEQKEMVNPVDTPDANRSGVQTTEPNQSNQINGAKGDTTKKIYYHRVPNQHELDSIKLAKTKKKFN